MLSLIVLGAIGSLGWSLYTRRIAWGCYGERPITLAVGLQATAVLMLVPPLAAPLNDAFHTLSGEWNLPTLIAHVLCMGADAAIVYHLAWRAQHDEEFRRGFKTYVEYPITAATGLLFALWLSGNGSAMPVKFSYLIPLDLSMRLYWTVLISALAWIMIYALHWMLVLREDARSRPVLNIYIGAGISGLLALLTRLIQVIIPSLNNEGGMLISSLFGCAAIVGFAGASTHSWTKKRQWLITPRLVIVEPKPQFYPRTDVSPL